jgi:hypothetical protein
MMTRRLMRRARQSRSLKEEAAGIWRAAGSDPRFRSEPTAEATA